MNVMAGLDLDGAQENVCLFPVTDMNAFGIAAMSTLASPDGWVIQHLRYFRLTTRSMRTSLQAL
jgi:hypothetical protein